MFTRFYGLETVTMRYFNVFGPRQDPGSPYSGVISLFIKALSEGDAPIIYGDGGQTRDFTYVTNVVDAVIRSAETQGVGGQVFNVATSSRISLNDLLAALKKIFGSNVEPITRTRAPAMCAIHRPTLPRRRRCSATIRRSASRKGCVTRSTGSSNHHTSERAASVGR